VDTALVTVSTRPERTGRRRLWLIVCAVGAGALLAGLALLFDAWRHPSAFREYGGSMTMKSWPVGTTGYVTITEPGEARGDVKVHGVALHDLSDSTGAHFADFICTLRPGPGLVGVWTSSQIHKHCRSLVPARGATMGLPRQQLLVAVTPMRPGTVSFRGVDLHYVQGWQNGTQHIGGDVKVVVTQPR
jgi:hypothetical protein